MMSFQRAMLALALSVSMLTFAPAQAGDAKPDPRSVVKEDVSPHDFGTTLQRLKAQLAKDGWTLLTEIDLGSRMAKRGVTLPGGLVILELTSGGATIPLLKDEATRYVAGLMPCSVSIYAQDSGQVVVSRMNAGLMAGVMEPRVAQVLGQSMARLDASVAAALKQD